MPRERRYYVYILTNWNHNVMYIGITNDPQRCVLEHKKKIIKGFTKKYNIT
ncbi:MAG: GIY-YIG nuclease family protein [Gammaproteobacteria bacterium]